MDILMIFLALVPAAMLAMVATAERLAARLRTAVFGGGCFWCMEPPFARLAGVVEVRVGYCGGEEENPTYQQVSSGRTSHLEAVQVVYDPERISYRQLLDIFWRSIDPTDPGGQFADRGNHYRTAIFYTSEEEKRMAEASRDELAAAGVFARPLVTAILPVKPFYPAEEYHQQYYLKNAAHYQAYKVGSGRAGFLEKAWPQGSRGGPAGGERRES